MSAQETARERRASSVGKMGWMEATTTRTWRTLSHILARRLRHAHGRHDAFRSSLVRHIITPILSNWFPLSTIPLVYIREEEMLARLWSLCSWKRYNNADYIYVVRIARTPVSFGTLDRGGAGQDIRYLQQVQWRIERQKRSRHCIDRWPCVRRKFGLRDPKRACSLMAVYLGRKGRSRAHDW